MFAIFQVRKRYQVLTMDYLFACEVYLHLSVTVTPVDFPNCRKEIY